MPGQTDYIIRFRSSSYRQPAPGCEGKHGAADVRSQRCPVGPAEGITYDLIDVVEGTYDIYEEVQEMPAGAGVLERVVI